ncbi:MAG: hypothetical protein KJ950_04510 [Proteobacteria bacterium]|nr:hypothetical protein [Pseudomonadota bacterium]MBU1688529.1 hypothetical protein [Pseudomonadota bacterium]
MTKKKLNCWEFKKCGREPGGLKTAELGICPATTENRLDGVHSGENAGRACWVVAGTYCKGEVQGSFAKKYTNCSQCEFHQLVQQEEVRCFKNSILLIKKLRDDDT